MSSDIASIIGANSAGAEQAVIKKKDELGQEEFMRLLVAQLNNQDPTKPMDNFEFLSQIAQFSTVSGIQDMQGSLSGVGESLRSTRAMQASSLVGRDVISASNQSAFKAGEEIEGVVALPVSASGVQIQVSDSAGQLVKTLAIGNVGAGIHKFSWDGLLADGESIPPGSYQVTASGVIDGAVEAVPAFASARVTSVSIGAGGADISLNLDGGESVSYADVLQYL
ncbi:MAG: flagellar hook assembly protein FlgD [Gammaproteobacteria bacterium]|nr:flagellar hook assembly protein FlgD [Gammaproteobacteria bacterium]MBQ0839506.1 flagellar hook assembly protein FlgD [Gammaproteobacteria bacterium]